MKKYFDNVLLKRKFHDKTEVNKRAHQKGHLLPWNTQKRFTVIIDSPYRKDFPPIFYVSYKNKKKSQ